MRLVVAIVAGAAMMTSVAAVGAAPPALSARANADYLAQNAKKPGVMQVPAIQYQVLKAGRGPQPARHDCVTVNYSGWLINGKVFDKTEPGKPATFPAGGLIPGWTVVLQMMHVGDKWRVTIPSQYAYGKAGADNVIPPDQTLVFDIELLKISKPMAGSC